MPSRRENTGTNLYNLWKDSFESIVLKSLFLCDTSDVSISLTQPAEQSNWRPNHIKTNGIAAHSIYARLPGLELTWIRKAAPLTRDFNASGDIACAINAIEELDDMWVQVYVEHVYPISISKASRLKRAA